MESLWLTVFRTKSNEISKHDLIAGRNGSSNDSRELTCRRRSWEISEKVQAKESSEENRSIQVIHGTLHRPSFGRERSAGIDTKSRQLRWAHEGINQSGCSDCPSSGTRGCNIYFYRCSEGNGDGSSQKSNPLPLKISKSLFSLECVISARSGRFYKVGSAEISHTPVKTSTHHL